MIYSTQSQNDKAETPINRLSDPPSSAIKDIVENAHSSVSSPPFQGT